MITEYPQLPKERAQLILSLSFFSCLSDSMQIENREKDDELSGAEWLFLAYSSWTLQGYPESLFPWITVPNN